MQVVWDAVNEAGGFGLYASFVLRIVAEEDASRVIWPASHAQGWAAGVHTLTGLPNGRPLINQKWCGRSCCSDTKEVHGPYVAAGWSDGGFAIDFGKFDPPMGAGMSFGYNYSGWPQPAPLVPFTPPLPPTFLPPAATVYPSGWTRIQGLEVGGATAGYFVSEFGVSGFSPFEALSPYFHPEHFGLHTPPFHRRRWRGSHAPDSHTSAHIVSLDAVANRRLCHTVTSVPVHTPSPSTHPTRLTGAAITTTPCCFPILGRRRCIGWTMWARRPSRRRSTSRCSHRRCTFTRWSTDTA